MKKVTTDNISMLFWVIVLCTSCKDNPKEKIKSQATLIVHHSKDRTYSSADSPFVRDLSINEKSILFSFGGAPLNKDSIELAVGDSILYKKLPTNDHTRESVLFLRKGEDLFKLKIDGKERFTFDVPKRFDHVNIFHTGYEVYVLYCYNPGCM